MVTSLAKHEELAFVAGVDEPLRLSWHSYGLRLLLFVRDEARRFAPHYHQFFAAAPPWATKAAGQGEESKRRGTRNMR